MTVEGARNFILTAKPSGADAAAMAQRFTDAGSLDGAFLLLQHAARNGDAKAAEQLGRLYDPKFFVAGKGPVAEASAERAIDWYERAAKAGDADASARLAELRNDPTVAKPDGAPRPRKPLRDVRRTPPAADCGLAGLGRPRPGAGAHALADRGQDDALPARPDPARGQDRRRGRRPGHDRGAALHAALRLRAHAGRRRRADLSRGRRGFEGAGPGLPQGGRDDPVGPQPGPGLRRAREPGPDAVLRAAGRARRVAGLRRSAGQGRRGAARHRRRQAAGHLADRLDRTRGLCRFREQFLHAADPGGEVQAPADRLSRARGQDRQRDARGGEAGHRAAAAAAGQPGRAERFPRRRGVRDRRLQLDAALHRAHPLGDGGRAQARRGGGPRRPGALRPGRLPRRPGQGREHRVSHPDLRRPERDQGRRTISRWRSSPWRRRRSRRAISPRTGSPASTRRSRPSTGPASTRARSS